MANPVEAVETALYSKLSTTAGVITALGGTLIYNKRAPQGSTKYALFQWQGGGDENETPHRTRNLVYYITGVAATQATAAAIDTAIDAALHNGSISPTSYTNFWLARETDINFVLENSAGVAMYHVGGLYRIRIDGGTI